MPHTIRILLLADTHLGFDLPVRPRVERRRRGHDFQANYEAALAPALAGKVDVVVHGGDLFHRPDVPASLAYQALTPLVAVAEAGVPVLVVPGNHERSRIPHARFGRHRRLHIFDRPRVFDLRVRGTRLRFAGFPFARRVRTRFPELVQRTGWRPEPSSLSLLCLHQCVEGATVGPSDFTFTTGDDVVRAGDIPRGLSAVLSGHIHRHQVLTRDLEGRAVRAPVLYPGSVERTSLAEIDEPKGYLVVELDPAWADHGSADDRLCRSPGTFHPLPARPMLVQDLDVGGRSATAVDADLRAILRATPPDAVLRIRPQGTPSDEVRRVLAAPRVRRLAPATMNVEIRAAGAGVDRRRRRASAPHRGQLRLGMRAPTR